MIYFVLPVYNEEKNICPLILKLNALMSGQNYIIIVINDGSTDSSLEVLTGLKSYPLIIESYFINMNIGAVFSMGIDKVLSKSKNNDDIIIILESDQTSELELVKKFILEIAENGNDVVIASRYQKGGGYRNFPLHRRVFSYFANLFLRMIFPINKNVSDYTIFLRAYRVGVLRPLIHYFSQSGIIQSMGFIANSELLIKISLFSKRIKEIPFVYDYGKKVGKSKMHILQTINEYCVFTCYMKNLIARMDLKTEMQI